MVDSAVSHPCLDFETTTPYDRYARIRELHSLQHPVTDDPAEMAFVVTTQVMELYFGLLRFEWEHAIAALRRDDARAATGAVRRSVHHLDALCAAWAALRWMTPTQFNGFRPSLGSASGFQSAMYRQVEFLLGNKSRSLTNPHRHAGPAYDELMAALLAPSLYDEVLRLLHRRGHAVPADRLDRDFAEPYEPADEVAAAWAAVYADPDPDSELRSLADALSDVAERWSDWRYAHVMAVRRTMGGKGGSGGSTGLSWLTRSLGEVVFPDLWAARTLL